MVDIELTDDDIEAIDSADVDWKGTAENLQEEVNQIRRELEGERKTSATLKAHLVNEQARLRGHIERLRSQLHKLGFTPVTAAETTEVGPAPSEADREYAAEIDMWRNDLEKGIAGALNELRAANSAYDVLVDRLYDVEFAEGSGLDIAHHLDIAARALRAADALRYRATS